MDKNSTANILSENKISKLLRQIMPGCKLKAISEVKGSFANYTHIIEAAGSDGELKRFAVKRYAVFGNYDRGEKAIREYRALEFVHKMSIPAPRPVYLDGTGSVLGMPGIVTEYVDGKTNMSPRDPAGWVRNMADTLAKIHSLPCSLGRGSFMLDADREAAWFLRDGIVPDFMSTYPAGIDVWNAANRIFKSLKQVDTSLVHIDYWPGNILWAMERIAAVLDWEEAAYGDPAIDVAYARMEITIAGFSEAAQEFLEAYENRTGKPTANLLFWELAAAARPMFSPQTWDIENGPRKAAFENFIKGSLQKAAL